MKVTLRLFYKRTNWRHRGNWLLVVSNGVTVREYKIDASCTDPNAAKAMARSILTDRGLTGVRWTATGESFRAEINTEKKKKPGQKKIRRKG